MVFVPPQVNKVMLQLIDYTKKTTPIVEVPVGAFLLDSDLQVIAAATNQRETRHDPTAHAELICLQQGGKIANSWRLTEYTLMVTVEPCAMCAGAIIASGIRKVIFGAFEPKTGAVGSNGDLLRASKFGKNIEVLGGVKATEASKLLQDFFKQHRKPGFYYPE